MDAPLVNVGIMTGKALSFVFNGEYIHTESSSFLTGRTTRVVCKRKYRV